MYYEISKVGDNCAAPSPPAHRVYVKELVSKAVIHVILVLYVSSN
jgi:hypothetical protein